MPQVLITGASGGIGQAVANVATGHDWEPICVGRSLDKLRGLLPGFHHVEADVTDESQVKMLFDDLEAGSRLPSALIHCVGSTLISPLDRVSAEQYAETIKINLTSAFMVSAHFISALKRASKPGAIVLFSSVVSRIGVANHEVIAAAKAGIEGFALSAAASYASLGIRVNVVAPGLTETPLTARMLSSEAGRVAANKQYPIAGINDANDVAETACWLISPGSARITGQIIAVDGGFSRIRPVVR